MRKLTCAGKFWVIYTAIIILLYFTGWRMAHCATLSLDNTAVTPSSYGVFAGTDYRIKLSNDRYFVSYEQLKLCFYYCGTNFNLVGIGINRDYKIGGIDVYINGGFYLIKNNVGYQEWNESIYYYMSNRFGAGLDVPHTGFRMDNKNGYGFEIGTKWSLGRDYGITAYYRHLQFFVNPIMYRPDGIWHDPVTMKLDGIGFGLYRKF